MRSKWSVSEQRLLEKIEKEGVKQVDSLPSPGSAIAGAHQPRWRAYKSIGSGWFHGVWASETEKIKTWKAKEQIELPSRPLEPEPDCNTRLLHSVRWRCSNWRGLAARSNGVSSQACWLTWHVEIVRTVKHPDNSNWWSHILQNLRVQGGTAQNLLIPHRSLVVTSRTPE